VSEPRRKSRPPSGRETFSFLAYVGKRFILDQCTVRAAGLTFTTLLAIVPLLAISFAIFSAFPAFDQLQMTVQVYIFENFVPQVGDTVLKHIEGFTQQTGKLTAVGIVFLAVTSIMLLLTISNAFDAIWHSQGERALISKLLVYWSVLTLAPLLLGASVSLSSYFFTIAQASGVERYTGPLAGLLGFLPLFFQFCGFAVLYMVMPNSPVRIRDALAGGLTAALLFEILKKLFGLYVTAFPTYETIYGALAVFPIFLVWMYISWLVVLLGAELTAAMPEWRMGERDVSATTFENPTLRLNAALSILYALGIASRSGRGMTLKSLSQSAAMTPTSAEAMLQTLEAAHFVNHSRKGTWFLTQSLSDTTLYDLQVRLGLAQDLPIADGQAPAWQGRYAEICKEVSNSSAQFMSLDLKTLLEPDDDITIDEYETSLNETSAKSATSKRTRLLAWFGLGWLGSS